MHKFIPMLEAMQIPVTKAAVDKEWDKLEKLPAWQMTKVRSEREVIKEAQKEGRTVFFAATMRSWNPNSPNAKDESYSEVTL